MSSHPPVPSKATPSNGDHPLMEKQVESSLPLLGDSQFELVLDPSMRVELIEDLDAPVEAQQVEEPIAVDEGDEVEDELRRYHGRRSLLLIGCNVLVLGAAGYYAYTEVVPLQQNITFLEDKKTVLEHELDQSKTLATSADARRESAEKEKAELEAALKTKETEWAAKQAILDADAEKVAWIPTTKAALEAALGAELKRGEVELSDNGKQLVVELADKALFANTEPVLGDKGKALLQKVGPLLVGRSLRIAGHLDAAPTGELAARYPTGWELSAVRSAQVARWLQDNAQIPGEKLVVEGYASFRPQVPGKNAAAKKRNRRVEIVVEP